MNIKLAEKNLHNNEVDTKVLAYYEEPLTLESIYENDEVQNMTKHLISNEVFKGKLGEVQSFILPRDEKPNKIILVGLGKKENFNLEGLRKSIAKVIKEGQKIKSKSIEIDPMGVGSGIVSLEESTRIISEISLLASYKFDKYQSDKKQPSIENIYILFEDRNQLNNMEAGLNEGLALGKSTIFARDLVNEPANVLLPIELANQAEKAGKENGFDVEVFDENKIEELDMKAFMSVARASDNPPRFIVMRYFGDAENKDEVLGLVGKGLTYDSGGLSIKTLQGMLNMKCDMGGAASVIGAMSAIAQLKLKINVVAVVAACENMIAGNAYRPGDIIGSMAGKTIAIGSTDAEGRLTLVDAVHYVIEKEGAKKIVDIATLTGAAIAALGTTTTAVVSNNDDFYKGLEKASELSGEKIWRMPAFDEYRELVKSKIADLTNSAGQPGTITAALFIEAFVQDKPWIHMDIAGTAFSSKASDYAPEGGTGAGVRSLYYLVKGLAQ